MLVVRAAAEHKKSRNKTFQINNAGSNLFQAGILSVKLSIPALALDARDSLGIARAKKMIAICTSTRLHNLRKPAVCLEVTTGAV